MYLSIFFPNKVSIVRTASLYINGAEFDGGRLVTEILVYIAGCLFSCSILTRHDCIASTYTSDEQQICD